MDGYEHRESLTDDAALERDLEALLAVEPSADFVARVRSRVAGEAMPSRWAFEWRIAVAAAIVVAAISGVTVWRSVSTGPAEPVKPRTMQSAVSPGSGAPAPAVQAATQTTTVRENPAIAPTPRVVSIARRNLHEHSPRAGIEMTLPSVIIADNEAKAYAQLRDDLRRARVLPPAPAPLEAVGVDKALEIDPLVIKPIVEVVSLE